MGQGLGFDAAPRHRRGAADITIRNRPGKGCVFVIDLPLVPETLEAALPVLKPTAL